MKFTLLLLLCLFSILDALFMIGATQLNKVLEENEEYEAIKRKEDEQGA